MYVVLINDLLSACTETAIYLYAAWGAITEGQVVRSLK